MLILLFSLAVLISPNLAVPVELINCSMFPQVSPVKLVFLILPTI